MKIFELLQEDINFAPLYELFTRTVSNAMYEKIYHIILAGIKNKNKVKYTGHKDDLQRWIENTLTTALNKFLQDHIDKKYHILWQEMKSDGYHDAWNVTIGLNIKMLYDFSSYVADLIIKYVERYFQDNEDNYELTSYDLNRLKEDIQHEFHWTVEKTITELTSIFFHEVTHHQQHTRSKKYSYRSYLEKDKEKFFNAIKRLETSDDYKIYRASPQEIDAFAKTIVGSHIQMFLDSMDNEPSEYKKYNAIVFYLEDFIKYFRFELKGNHITKYYKDTYSEKHKKIYRRFIKKLYQEFNNILEYYKEKDTWSKRYWGHQ